MTESSNNSIESIAMLASLAIPEPQGATAPLVSIYLPVAHQERTGRLDDATRILFKDLANQARTILQDQWPDHRLWLAIDEALTQLETQEDAPAWLNALSSIGFLISNQGIESVSLPITIEPTVVVGDYFYYKPLLAAEAASLNYDLLALSSDRFGIVSGNGTGVQRRKLPAETTEMIQAAFPYLDGTEGMLDVQDPDGHESPYHLWHSRHDVKKAETEKFFSAVDKALCETLYKDSTTPLILVTLPEHQGLFRSLSHLTNLLPVGIEKDPQSLSGSQLRDDALTLCQTYRDQALANLGDKLGEQLSHQKATCTIADIANALVERKVAALYVTYGAAQGGVFDPQTGAVTSLETPTAENEPDLIDMFIQTTREQGGVIIVVPEGFLPSQALVAASYRY